MSENSKIEWTDHTFNPVRGCTLRDRGLPTLGDRVARMAATRRAHLDGLVAQMYADYQAGASLNSLAKKYGRSRKCFTGLFTARGLTLRPGPVLRRDAKTGRILPRKVHTPEEIAALIARLTRLVVPAELRAEWRDWPMARRIAFIAQVRRHLASPHDQPQSPFSPNVEPFAYGSPRAHAIADRANAGLGSRDWKIHLKIHSQGVIWRDRLCFWAPDSGECGGAYYTGIWTPSAGRPSLHHLIYAETHGAVPRGHVVRMRDGNPNNLDPSNLVLAHRNEVCRENQARALSAKAREQTALLLQRHQQPADHADHAHHDLISRIARHPHTRGAARAAR